LKILFQNLLSLYLTGSANSSFVSKKEKTTECPYSEEELAELEMTSQEWKDSQENCFKFKEQALCQEADWDTFSGYMRNSGLGTFDSLFSGIGSGFVSDLNFASGVKLAGLSLLTSFASQTKNIPLLSTNFSLFDFGGRLVRAPLHIFDSAFSLIGEKGSEINLPSILAGSVSLFGLSRVLTKNDSERFKLPNTTIGGTLGRTAVHHLESMLASKASQLSGQNQTGSAFLATSATTLGLLLPKGLKDTKLPYRTFEGLISQGSTHFLDSLFSGIGNSFSRLLNTPKNLFLGALSLSVGLTAIGSLSKIKNFRASYSQLGGRLIRSILHVPETFVFNAGNILGSSSLGMPLSLGFTGLTSFTCFTKSGESILKNFKVPIGTLGGQFQRLPFDFIHSTISASAMQLSKLIPAPLLVILGPALSFKLGEKIKNTNAKYTDLKGLMIRNTTHLWETILSNAAFKTGRMVTNNSEESSSSGSVLADGRWLTNEGQIVPTMAIGKQMKSSSEENNIKGVILGALGGIGFAFGASTLGKLFMKGNNNDQIRTVTIPIENKNQNIEIEVTKAVPEDVRINNQSLNNERVMV